MVSLQDEQAAEIINNACRLYDLGSLMQWSILRVYTNEVYLIQSEKGKFILKVYAPDWREESHLRYELHLLAHLKRKDFAAAGVLLDQNGKALHERYERRWAMYEYAPGTKPKQPWTGSLFKDFGCATAKLHEALDDYESPHVRFAWEVSYLLVEPFETIQKFLNAEDVHYLQSMADKTKEYIENHEVELDWGACHGDLTPDNIHIDDLGLITFYDFDSGGPGWRAAEFRDIWWRQQQLHDGSYEALIEGYKSARTMSQINFDSVPFFVPAYEIWGFAMDWEHGHVHNEPGGKDAYIKRKMAKLHDWEEIVAPTPG